MGGGPGAPSWRARARGTNSPPRRSRRPRAAGFRKRRRTSPRAALGPFSRDPSRVPMQNHLITGSSISAGPAACWRPGQSATPLRCGGSRRARFPPRRGPGWLRPHCHGLHRPGPARQRCRCQCVHACVCLYTMIPLGVHPLGTSSLYIWRRAVQHAMLKRPTWSNVHQYTLS